jgi:hypothetical protein
MASADETQPITELRQQPPLAPSAVNGSPRCSQPRASSFVSYTATGERARAPHALGGRASPCAGLWLRFRFRTSRSAGDRFGHVQSAGMVLVFGGSHISLVGAVRALVALPLVIATTVVARSR